LTPGLPGSAVPARRDRPPAPDRRFPEFREEPFFSACVSTRTSAKSVAWRETSIECWQTQAARHELYVSDKLVVAADE
jgi:hypothetical protein